MVSKGNFLYWRGGDSTNHNTTVLLCGWDVVRNIYLLIPVESIMWFELLLLSFCSLFLNLTLLTTLTTASPLTRCCIKSCQNCQNLKWYCILHYCLIRQNCAEQHHLSSRTNHCEAIKGVFIGDFFFFTTTLNSRVKIGGTNYYIPGSVYGSVTFKNVLIWSFNELFISCVIILICVACSGNWLSLYLFCYRVLGDQLCLTHWSTLCACTWVKPINNRHFSPVLGSS